jgi:hypothetical protein
MTVYLNRRILGGIVKDPPERGRSPYPWMLLRLEIIGTVWDNMGRKTIVKTYERVIIRGQANLNAVGWVVRGSEVIVEGISMPAYAVVGDAEIKGNVTVAETFQRPGAKED